MTQPVCALVSSSVKWNISACHLGLLWRVNTPMCVLYGARQVLRDNYTNHFMVILSSFRLISDMAAGKSFSDLPVLERRGTFLERDRLLVF